MSIVDVRPSYASYVHFHGHYQAPNSEFKRLLTASPHTMATWTKLFETPNWAADIASSADLDPVTKELTYLNYIDRRFGGFAIRDKKTYFFPTKGFEVIIVGWKLPFPAEQAFCRNLLVGDATQKLWVPFDGIVVSSDNDIEFQRTCGSVAKTPFRRLVEEFISWWLGGDYWSLVRQMSWPSRPSVGEIFDDVVREDVSGPQYFNRDIIRRAVCRPDTHPPSQEIISWQEPPTMYEAYESVFNFNPLTVNIVEVVRLEMYAMASLFQRKLTSQKTVPKEVYPTPFQSKVLIGSYPTKEDILKLDVIKNDWEEFLNETNIAFGMYRIPAVGANSQFSGRMNICYFFLSWKDPDDMTNAFEVHRDVLVIRLVHGYHDQRPTWSQISPFDSVIRSMQMLTDMRHQQIKGSVMHPKDVVYSLSTVPNVVNKGDRIIVNVSRQQFLDTTFDVLKPAIVPLPFGFFSFLGALQEKELFLAMCRTSGKDDGQVERNAVLLKDIIEELEKAKWTHLDPVVTSLVGTSTTTPNIELVDAAIQKLSPPGYIAVSLVRAINDKKVETLSTEMSEERKMNHLFGRLFFILDSQFIKAKNLADSRLATTVNQ